MAMPDDESFVGGSSDGAGAPEAPDESNATMSLMGGVARPAGLPEADLEFEEAKGASKVFGQGTMLLVMLFVVAAGSLYAMRLSQGDLSTGAVSKDVEARIEEALARLSKRDVLPDNDPLGPGKIGEIFGDTDKIIAMFASDPTERQVPLAFVKKNPFVLPVYRTVEAKDTGDDGAKASRAKLEEELKMLKRELDRLELQSVMLGARPVAIIDGEFYQPGQKVGSFKVVAINDLSVVLESAGHQFTLEIEQPAERPGRGGRGR